MPLLVRSLAILLLMHLGACCTGDIVLWGLRVTVTDQGARVCDATVIAIDGSYTETLIAIGSDINCVYTGAPEREGQYRITAMSNSRIGTATATVGEGCGDHVETEDVAIELR
jgi:hypothetical protein